jgi:hypothetical protein
MQIHDSEKARCRFDLFDVVSHYAEAAELVQDLEERLLVAQLNLKAAIKGKNSMGVYYRKLSCPHSFVRCAYDSPTKWRRWRRQRTKWRARWPRKA